LSLRRGLLASYGSQIYVALVGLLMVPVYLRYLGAEAYGLVGFFAALQAWFQLLDIGLSPTLARETARFRGGATSALDLRRLLRGLEALFCALALVGGVTLALLSPWLASQWLQSEHLSGSEVRQAVLLMAMTVPLRWVGGLYRGALMGLEQLVWLGGFNAAAATARFVGVIAVLQFVSNDVVAFFTYQLVLGSLELLILWFRVRSSMPPGPSSESWRPAWLAVRRSFGLSSTVAISGIVWVLVQQIDKLVLSRMIPLRDFGYFMIAASAASAVTLLASPLAAALAPALARLHAQGNGDEVTRLYLRATLATGAVSMPVAAVLALHAPTVLMAWTGNAIATEFAAPLLGMYALGNALLTLAALPYYLLFARGRLLPHMLANLGLAVVLTTVVIIGARANGSVGAAFAWLASIGSFFLLWPPVAHSLHARGVHRAWIIAVLRVALPAFSVTWLAGHLIDLDSTRASLAAQLVALWCAATLVTLACAPSLVMGWRRSRTAADPR
jgi:O-antigen/teichoic acid export membrane protein